MWNLLQDPHLETIFLRRRPDGERPFTDVMLGLYDDKEAQEFYEDPTNRSVEGKSGVQRDTDRGYGPPVGEDS